MYCRVVKTIDEQFKRVSYKILVEDEKTMLVEEFDPCFVGGEQFFICWPAGEKVELITLKRKTTTDAVVEHGHAYEIKNHVYGFVKRIHGANIWIDIEKVLISFYHRQNLRDIEKPAKGDIPRVKKLGRMR